MASVVRLGDCLWFKHIDCRWLFIGSQSLKSFQCALALCTWHTGGERDHEKIQIKSYLFSLYAAAFADYCKPFTAGANHSQYRYKQAETTACNPGGHKTRLAQQV